MNDPKKPNTPIRLEDYPDDGYIRKTSLLKVVPFSEATLFRYVKKGAFPKPIPLSDTIRAWRVGDIREWLRERHEQAAGA